MNGTSASSLPGRTGSGKIMATSLRARRFMA
jgi:hypothetical protein